MSDFTHIVRFLEVTPHEVRLQASSDAEALAICRRYAETLSPSERKRTFVTADTRYDQFEVEQLGKRVRVSIEARAIYEIDLTAQNQTEAESKAVSIWEHCGPEDFEFQDFMDFRAEATEVEQ